MTPRQKHALRLLLGVANDNGKALDRAGRVLGELEARQNDFEALIGIMAGQKIPDDFLSRRKRTNTNPKGGGDD